MAADARSPVGVAAAATGLRRRRRRVAARWGCESSRHGRRCGALGRLRKAG